MKNPKLSGPFWTAFLAALIDIAGILLTCLLYCLFGAKAALLPWPWSQKMLGTLLDGLFFIFYLPGMIFNPLLWALGGLVFYYVRRNIRNGGLHIAR